jgi:hypothetical protein
LRGTGARTALQTPPYRKLTVGAIAADIALLLILQLLLVLLVLLVPLLIMLLLPCV